MKRTSDKHLKVLDGLRGGAAFYVMLTHAIWLLAVPAGPREGRIWWEWLQVGLAFLFRHGREVVMLFFVLSGFVIHLRLAQSYSLGKGGFSFSEYIKSRFFRIYPPFLAALFFTLLVDWLGRSVNLGFYTGSALQMEYADYGIVTFVGNLFLLQGWLVPVYGTNFVVWSLAYETFFYMFYPILFVPTYLRWGRRIAFAGWLSICAVNLGVWLISRNVFWLWGAYLGLWLVGALVAELFISYRRHADSKILLLFCTSLILLGLLVISYDWLGNKATDSIWPLSKEFIWGGAWAGVIIGLVLLPDSRIVAPVRLSVEALCWLAPQSYTLYLFHQQSLIFLSALYLTVIPALPQHFGLVFVGTFGVIVFTAALSRWIENIGR